MKKTIPIAVAALWCVFAVSAIAAPKRYEWSRADAVEAAVKTYNQKFHVPAMSIAVIKNGDIIFARGWGIANPLKGQMADQHTLYRLASMSKSLTGVLAGDLMEKNKIAHGTKARTVISSLPAFHTETFEQLLSHMGGVRHYQGSGDPCNWQTTQYMFVAGALKLFQMSPLVAKPGDKYSYSTPGFSIAGAMMEKRSGLPFMIYAAQRFGQWGFPGIHPEAGQQAKRAMIFKWDDNKNKPADRDNISWKYPGGGFEASVRDLCLFAAKLMNGQILPQSRLNDIWTARKDSSGKSSGYGLGWSVGTSDGKRMVDHSGSQNGANSYWRLYPDDKIAVVLLSNRSDHDPAHLGGWVARVAAKPANASIDPYKAPTD